MSISRTSLLSRAAALCALTAATLLAAPATADTITQWNFNTTVGANNTPAASFSVGASSASIVGMNGGPNGDILLANAGNSSASQFSSDPIGTTTTGDAWRVRGVTANGYSTSNLTSGAQFTASTVGYNNITVSLDVYSTGGASRYAQFEYTTDGSTYTPLGSPSDLRLANTALTGSSYPEGWVNGLSFDLSSIPGASNNANFGFRFVTAFSPVSFTDTSSHGPNSAFQRTDLDPAKAYDPTKGNLRFDMVTFSGAVIPTPEPSSFILAGMGLAGLGLAYRRRTHRSKR